MDVSLFGFYHVKNLCVLFTFCVLFVCLFEFTFVILALFVVSQLVSVAGGWLRSVKAHANDQ